MKSDSENYRSDRLMQQTRIHERTINYNNSQLSPHSIHGTRGHKAFAKRNSATFAHSRANSVRNENETDNNEKRMMMIMDVNIGDLNWNRNSKAEQHKYKWGY